MADGKLTVSASLMALLANCNRDDKRKPHPFVMEDFHPLRRAKKVRRKSPDQSIDSLIRFLDAKEEPRG